MDRLVAFEDCDMLWQTMRSWLEGGRECGVRVGGRVICGDARLTGVERGGSGSGRRMVSRGWVVGMLGCWDARRLGSGEQDDTDRVPALIYVQVST